MKLRELRGFKELATPVGMGVVISSTHTHVYKCGNHIIGIKQWHDCMVNQIHVLKLAMTMTGSGEKKTLLNKSHYLA